MYDVLDCFPDGLGLRTGFRSIYYYGLYTVMLRASVQVQVQVQVQQ